MRGFLWASILLMGTALGQPADRIYFSALNKEEKPVLGLKATDFELRINGEPAPLEGFKAGQPYTDRSVPLVAWILLDFNPHITKSLIQNQADAVAAAFKMLHRASAIGVKLVSDMSETLAPLSHDPKSLRNAFVQFQQQRLGVDVGPGNESIRVGNAGIAAALGPAIDEIVKYIDFEPSMRDQEIHRAIMIISDANLNPAYNLKPLYAKAARENVFLYPIYVPQGPYGLFVQDYFKLAQNSAGLAAVFGALKPGSEILPLPRGSEAKDALAANFIHVVRDLNGKYSFVAPSRNSEQPLKISLKCKAKGVRIRLARTTL